MRVYLLILTFLLSITVTSVGAYAGEVVIVVNKNFPVESMTPTLVKQIYTGKVRTREGVPLKAYDLPDDSPAKDVFVRDILGFRSVIKYNSYWIGKVFREGGVPPTLKKNAGELLKSIADEPGGIGYCDKSEVGSQEGIKILMELK